MKVFLSSTFRDLVPEREAVLAVLRKRQQTALPMEDFFADPAPPLDAALEHLRNADVVVLLLGFKTGSLLPDGSGRSYTRAEYDEAKRLGLDVLPFLKQEKGRWPWDGKERWVNKEKTWAKRDALDAFKADVGQEHTWDPFTTPDGLALNVYAALDAWDNKGRPGARRTFSSAKEYFGTNAPPFLSTILDLSTSLVGRVTEIAALDAFLKSPDRSVCVVSGRGGIGKSKLIQDWIIGVKGWQVILLKYAPLWHQESEKEIPVGPTVIVIDDSHRSEIEEDIGKVVQLFGARRIRQPMKLLFSTRPGVSSYFLRYLRRMIFEQEIQELPELAELDNDQSENLAREVLGPSHSGHAGALSEIAGKSPLVIVAGGRLIAAGRHVRNPR